MGAQGCGKGTQAKLLKDAFDLIHISVGDILRWNVQNHTKLGARVRRIVASGQLVSDEVICELVHHRLAEHDWNYGFILDGYPRNLRQAEALLESFNVDAVVYIDVPDAVVFERVLARRLCSGCGLDYNLIAHRPAEPDTCDVCHARLVTRPDDTPEAVRRRLADFHEQTQPIVDLFRRKGIVVDVDGTKSPEEVQRDIRAALSLQSVSDLAAAVPAKA
jgi:adenylate kinase